jgi:hypothetical protein
MSLYTRVIRDALDADVTVGIDEIVLCLGSVRSATIARQASLTVVGEFSGDARVTQDTAILVYGTVTGTMRIEARGTSIIQGEIRGRVESAGTLILDADVTGELETTGQLIRKNEVASPQQREMWFGEKRPFLQEL